MAGMKKAEPRRWGLFAVSAALLALIVRAGSASDPVSRALEREVGQPSPASPLPFQPNDLAALVTVNREAAAQVALVGLVPVERRVEAALTASSWMKGMIVALPQTGPYDTRQRLLLEAWSRALRDYANGGRGSLMYIRAASQVNAALHAEMVEQLRKVYPPDSNHLELFTARVNNHEPGH